MKRHFRRVEIALFATVNMTVGSGATTGGNTSNGYVVNAYGNTVATSGNDFSPEQAKFYAKAFIKNHMGRLVHGQFGEKLTFPKHSGNIVNVRALSPYPVATTPLTEGVTPPGNDMNFYYVEIPVYQYGKYTPITDWADFVSRDDVLLHDSEELSSQSGRTIETIDAEALNACKSVIYAPSVASNGTVTEVHARTGLTPLCKFSIDTVMRAVTYLKVQNTETIDGSYVAIINPNVEYDVLTDPKFVDVVKYAAVERIFNGEIGKIGNVRFVVSSFAKVFANSGAYKSGSSGDKWDVYSTLVLGKDAYKVLEIEGQGMQTIIKPLGSAGSADPINQRGSQGWKTTHGIGITGQTCIVRIESCATLSYTAKANSWLHAQQNGYEVGT